MNPQTVLVVDDYSATRRILASLIKSFSSYQVIEAQDGQEAVQKLAEGGIDCVVSDWDMPHMDGMELLKHVRSNKSLKHLPFLMVSAEGHRSNIARVTEAGADAYLLKPFTPAALYTKLKQVCERTSKV